MKHNYSFTTKEKTKLKEPIVSNFLKEEINHQKFKAFIESPRPETKDALDSAFKSYYKRVKVISYIDKLIHYYSMDLDKRRNKHYTNHQLILDRPVGENSSTTMKNNVVSHQLSVVHSCQFPLEELLGDLNLYKAWSTLSFKQKAMLKFNVDIR